MRRISSFLALSCTILFASSCAKELNSPNVQNTGKQIEISILASNKPAVETDTKTFIDGTSVKWSSTGETLKVYEVATPSEGDAITSYKTSAAGVTSDEGATMTFGVTLDDKSAGYTNFDYYAVYPSTAPQSVANVNVNSVALNTVAAQTPTATNFDASQDLLIAKPITSDSQPASLEMQFARVIAIGKMTIKNLGSSEDITKITFSAKVGDTPVNLAGRTNFNLATATPVTNYASNTQETSIILNYEGQSIKANSASGMTAYFVCYPFTINAETPGSFKVVVETATHSYEREVSVSTETGLSLKAGKASVFAVNMAGVVGTAKAVDLRYAYLDYNDYTTAGGNNSYGNITVNKSHGDTWETFACTTNNAIGVRRNDNGSNDSYIKLPDFKENIKEVVVTLKNVTADKTITLENASEGNTGSIASLTTTAETVYTFDLTEKSVKTAYFRSNGAQAQVEKIEVYAGEDNREAFTAPATVTASLNASVPNSIDVVWSSVDGASGYVITLVPETGDNVVVKAASSPYTVEGLAYDMKYLVSVQAEPADYYVNTISGEKVAEDVVTTGSEPAVKDYSKIYTSNVTLTAGTNGSAAKVIINDTGYDAIKVGTGSLGGSMSVTVPAGSTALHVHAAAWNGVTGLSLNITPVANVSSNTIALTADSGISGNSPFTLNGTASDYYYKIDLSNITEDTKITFTSSTTKRFVVWGVNAETDDRTPVTLSFVTSSYEFQVGSDDYNAFTYQTATASPSVAGITYSIEDEDGIATGFNTSTGAFTLSGNTGTATITASFAGDEDYRAAEASYTVKVNAAGAVLKSITINTSTKNFPTAYGTANTFTEYTLEGYKFKIQQGYINGSKLQWRASNNSNGAGTIYNTQKFPSNINSIVLVYDSSDSKKNFVLNVGTEENPTSGTSITPTNDANLTYTFDCSEGKYDYFVLTNGLNAGYLTSITINWYE